MQEHCSDAAVAAGTQAARAVASVSDVLARVSEAHDATGEVWLLYWRGVLQECIDREERAIEDLEAFLAAPTEGGLEAQREDAARRLRRLGRKVDGGSSRSGPPAAGIAVTGGLLGAGGVLGGLAGWQGGEFQQNSTLYAEGGRTWSETEAFGVEADAAAQRATGLGVAAAGLGVGGAVALVVTLVQGPSNAPVAAVVPTDGGLAVSIGGRW